MRETWRWFGKHDIVSLDDIRQAGAQGVVTALHHINNGELWTKQEINNRVSEVSVRSNGESTGLSWDVVESLPISEEIKKQDGQWRDHIENYKTSLINLANAGINTVCYNFMPILDWTRTDLSWRLPNGGTCMRFDYIDYLLFDTMILLRPGADDGLSDEIKETIKQRYAGLSDQGKQRLTNNIVAGLPGANQNLSLTDINGLLGQYNEINAEKLRENLIVFLELVVPTAEEHGVKLCCHPDDPPFSLLGLPRVMSTEDDYKTIVNAVASPSNGITLCSGSLGVRPENDLPGMMRRLGKHVHFLHLRNVLLEGQSVPGSFHESEHLVGNTDMVALVKSVLDEERRRTSAGQSDVDIPMRPDHGQDILDDLTRQSQPGYPAIGRLKGLAELRGVAAALSHGSESRSYSQL